MVVAWLIRRNTAVRNEWVSEQLHIGRASKLSCFVKQVEDATAEECLITEVHFLVSRSAFPTSSVLRAFWIWMPEDGF